MSTTALIAIGGYSRSGSGRGAGIELVRIDTDADGVVTHEHLSSVELANPTFVLWNQDGSLLYAVLETSPTRVVAVRVEEDGRRAHVVADFELEGEGGCHLAYGKDRRTLLIANYGSGSVETVRLDAQGLPVEQIDLDSHHDRADGAEPHPHQVVALPSIDAFAVPDLGLDRIFLYRQDHSGQIALVGEIPVARGSGPRHLVAEPESGQLFISCERSGMVAVAIRREEPARAGSSQLLQAAGHRWSLSAVVPASAATEPQNAVSHLEITADEGTLLVANRGPDTISAMSLDQVRPQLVAEVPVGAHPGHFTQLGELILVAAQESDRVDVLRLRRDEFSVAGQAIPAPSAACVAVRPHA